MNPATVTGIRHRCVALLYATALRGNQSGSPQHCGAHPAIPSTLSIFRGDIIYQHAYFYPHTIELSSMVKP